MKRLEVKRNKMNYEVNIMEKEANGKSSSSYRNIINKDPNQIAQILIDLHLEGFPIEKAIEQFTKRLKNKDWLGF